MVVKSGKAGKFLACPSYPDCRSTMSIPTDEMPKLAGKCPECGAAMTVRKSKRGKTYYSCLGYPDCKFMSWDVPTGEKCPQCGEAIVRTSRGNERCSNKDCSYKLKTEKKAKTQVVFEDDFVPPPLEEEPVFVHFEDNNYYEEN